MVDLVHVVLAATAVYTVAAAVLTLGARGLLRRRLRTRPSMRFGDPTSVALLVMPTAVAGLWVGSALVHELEPGRVLRDCCLLLAAEIGVGELVSVVMVAVIALGGAMVARELVMSRRSVRDLDRSRACSERIQRICAEAPILSAVSHHMSVVEGLGQAAATRGFIRPRIEVDHTLVARVDDDQLRAVLLHEAAHLQGRDPWRLALTAVAIGLNPFGRWLRPILQQWRFARELQCDRAAVSEGADPLALAGAIVTAARQANRRAACCAGVADSSPAEIRARVELLTAYAHSEPAKGPAEGLSVGAAMLTAAVLTVAPHFLGATLAIHCVAERAFAPWLHMHG